MNTNAIKVTDFKFPDHPSKLTRAMGDTVLLFIRDGQEVKKRLADCTGADLEAIRVQLGVDLFLLAAERDAIETMMNSKTR